MCNLEQIKQTIIANGSITSSDIPDLRKIVYKDGRVSRFKMYKTKKLIQNRKRRKMERFIDKNPTASSIILYIFCLVSLISISNIWGENWGIILWCSILTLGLILGKLEEDDKVILGPISWFVVFWLNYIWNMTPFPFVFGKYSRTIEFMFCSAVIIYILLINIM